MSRFVSLSVFFLLLITTSSQAFSAACPASSSAETTGANDGDNCTVTDASTGTVIQLNFITGFDSATLIENDSTAQITTDTYLTSLTGGTYVSENSSMLATAAAASKASGNNGTTVGAQRKLAFIKAAEIIAAQITTSEPILVDADFTTLSCSQGGATLGSASATSFVQNASAPTGALNSTWYPVGLYNSLDGADNYPSGGPLNANPNTVDNGGNINADSDIFARYNSDTGTTNCLDISNGWYYGFDTPPSAIAVDDNGDPLPFTLGGEAPMITYIGFTTVLLHEMMHGLGFSSLTSATTGTELGSMNDIYSTFLKDNATGKNWGDAAESDANRIASAKSGTGLLWTGTNVNTQAVGLLTDGYQDNDTSSTFTSGDFVEMYAPDPVESGSSVSHFNTDVSPNELMEPQYTEGSLDLGLSLYLLKDIGWTINVGSNNAPSITAVDQSTNEDTSKVVDASGWASDADGGDTLTYTVASSCATNITCSINTDGTSFTMTPDANHNGGTHTITINVSDGNGGTDSDTLNLTVTAVNDAPSITGFPDIGALNQGATSSAIDLDAYTSDVDGDTVFTYTDTACGAHLTCNISGSSLTITAGTGFAGTESVTIQAEDAGGLTDTDTFDVTINAAGNTAPVLGSIGNQTAPVNASVVITLSATDGEGNALTYSDTSDVDSVASIVGTTLTLNKASIGTFNVTVQVSDGSLNDSETFTFTTYAEPSIDVGSASLDPNDTLTIANSGTSIDISNVGNTYSYALEFEGANATNLLGTATNTLTIDMPTSGQFAGEYVLTFTDSNTGDTYDFTFVRAPRLVFSASKLLANHSTQTLDIEGGAAGTTYTLGSSETSLTFKNGSNTVTTANATNDSTHFNKASVTLAVGSITASTSVEVDVSSIYIAATSSGLTLEPVRTHELSIEDASGNTLSDVTVKLDTSPLSAYNLTSDYESDAQGNVSIQLPADTNNYSAVASFTGYSDADITLDSTILTQTVTMDEITQPMSIAGDISALGNLSFASVLPVVTLVLDDNSEINIPVSKTNNSLVIFDYVHNLATGNPSTLEITHPSGVGLIFNIDTTDDYHFDIFMKSSTQVVSNGSSSAGTGIGSLGIWSLILLLLGLPKRYRKCGNK